MDNDIKYTNNPRNGKALVGVILLMVGVILLLQQYIIPGWVKLWPLSKKLILRFNGSWHGVLIYRKYPQLRPHILANHSHWPWLMDDPAQAGYSG